MSEQDLSQKISELFSCYSEEITSKINSLSAENIAIKTMFNTIQENYDFNIKEMKSLIKNIKVQDETISFYKEIIKFMMENFKRNDEEDY